MAITIIENILQKNRCYVDHKDLTPKGLILHSVGCAQPSANVFMVNWNKYIAPGSGQKNKCVHGFIDANTGIIYQTLPYYYCADHCGGMGNYTHIGFEMCEPGKDVMQYVSGTTVNFTDKSKAEAIIKMTYDKAVELYAKLCVEFGLDATSILSHSEAHKVGIASNHGDPEHLWRQTSLGLTMDGFRKDVKAILASGGQNVMKPYIDSVIGYATNLTVGDVLNVRTGAGTSFPILAEYPALGSGNGFEICGTDQSRKWLYICIKGEHYGWVNKAYVTINL